ncbi:MAG: hypothetical protein JXN65_08470 [Clostridia bacterium]|nr:hypothetical protein [Clostridia bacterium]
MKIENNYLVKSAVFLIFALVMILAGCEKSDADIAQIDELAKIVNKNIVQVGKEDLSDKSNDADIDWIEQQLQASKLCERPDEIIALDSGIALLYDDGTMSVLRLLNPDDGIFSIRYGTKLYCLKNDNIAQWMLKIANRE